MSQQKLVDALERYQEYEEYAQKLRRLIELGEVDVLMPVTFIDVLESIEDSIWKRIHDVNNQIEHIKNEPMDRFRRRQV